MKRKFLFIVRVLVVLSALVAVVPSLGEASNPQAPCALICFDSQGLALVQGSSGYPQIRWIDQTNNAVVSVIGSVGADVSVNSNASATGDTGIVSITSQDSQNRVLHLDSTSDADNGQFVNIYSSDPSGFKGLVLGSSGYAELSDGPGVDVDGKLLRLRQSKTPANASAPCYQGEIAWNSTFIFVCVGSNTWKRAGLASW